MKPFPSPTSNTRINTQMSHDHRTIHTSVHTVLYDRHTTNTVSYDRHTTNTVPVRIIHGQVRPDMVSSSVQSSCMIIQHSNTTENTTTCCHLETTDYLLHNASKEEEGPQKNPQREYKKGYQHQQGGSSCNTWGPRCLVHVTEYHIDQT